jgi:hypothetical protein
MSMVALTQSVVDRLRDFRRSAVHTASHMLVVSRNDDPKHHCGRGPALHVMRLRRCYRDGVQ